MIRRVMFAPRSVCTVETEMNTWMRRFLLTPDGGEAGGEASDDTPADKPPAKPAGNPPAKRAGVLGQFDSLPEEDQEYYIRLAAEAHRERMERRQGGGKGRVEADDDDDDPADDDGEPATPPRKRDKPAGKKPAGELDELRAQVEALTKHIGVLVNDRNAAKHESVKKSRYTELDALAAKHDAFAPETASKAREFARLAFLGRLMDEGGAKGRDTSKLFEGFLNEFSDTMAGPLMAWRNRRQLDEKRRQREQTEGDAGEGKAPNRKKPGFNIDDDEALIDAVAEEFSDDDFKKLLGQ